MTEPVVYWFSSPRRANLAGVAYVSLTVVDVSRARRTPSGERAPGESVSFVPTVQGEVNVAFERAEYFHDAAQAQWYPDGSAPRVEAQGVVRQVGRGPVARAELLRFEGSDPAMWWRLPAALEGTVERLADDPAAMRDLGARATRILLAWAGIRR